MASRIAWWGTGASIFRPLKNQPSPGFRAQLQMLKLWMRGRNGGKHWPRGPPRADGFEALEALLVSLQWEPAFPWDLLSPL